MRKIGTKNAPNFITNVIYNKPGNNIPTPITFLDRTKVFNTVNHELLVTKLYNYDIRDDAH